MPPTTLYIGPLYHTLSLASFEHLPLACIAVSDGIIVSVACVLDGHQDPGLEERLADTQVVRLERGQFFVPGFVDTHIHGPQFVFTGTGYDLPLLKWLETYTFPKEAAFKDLEYAETNYTKVVRKSLSCGTLKLTQEQQQLVISLQLICIRHWAFVGKVNMDRNSPDYYTETTDESKSSTLEFIAKMKSLNSPLITPILTPRFVPSCTPELMSFLGDIAKEHTLPIQSHLSETFGELAWVKELHPDQKDYSSVYNHYGLLTSKTIMAHCIHLSQSERDLLKKRQVGISHCASSNFCLASGVMNLRQLIDEGHEKIGLGTDVAGGYSASIHDAIRQTLTASKVTEIATGQRALDYKQVFHLATLGGAKCMNLESKIGNFVPGKEFDALVVDMNGIDTFGDDDVFQKFIYLGDDRNIKRVFVAGKEIKGL